MLGVTVWLMQAQPTPNLRTSTRLDIVATITMTKPICIFSKVLQLPNLLYDTYEFAQYVKAGKAFSFAFDGIFWKTAGKFGLGFGYFMSGIQVFNMGKAIFTQPDFENSKWILY